MNKIIYTLLFIITSTMVINIFPNKSNIPNKYIIPVIMALQAKYYFGDWDKGYSFTNIDIVFWICCLTLSFFVIKVQNNISKNLF